MTHDLTAPCCSLSSGLLSVSHGFHIPIKPSSRVPPLRFGPAGDRKVRHVELFSCQRTVSHWQKGGDEKLMSKTKSSFPFEREIVLRLSWFEAANLMQQLTIHKRCLRAEIKRLVETQE